MEKEQGHYIAALDIGSSKIAVAVASVSEDGRLRFVGFGKVPSKGIRQGCVQNIELAVTSIRNALEEAKEISRIESIPSVYVALTGKGLHSINKQGRVVIQDGQVTEANVKKAQQLALAFDSKEDGNAPDDKIVSHVLQMYTIGSDDTPIYEPPVGYKGEVLRAYAHLAIGPDSMVQNLLTCVRRAGVDVDGLVLQPWASAASCLTQTEKKLGVILLDFGAGLIDIACYKDDIVQYTAVATAGGNLFTNDIATYLKCTIEEAERIKLAYGHIPERPSDRYEKIHYTYEPTGKAKEVTSAEIVNVLEQRLRELIGVLRTYYLDKQDWTQQAAAGVVITGGMAEMPGFDKVIEDELGLKVRIGHPNPWRGGGVSLVSPADSTVMGVLDEVRRRRMIGERSKRSSRGGSRIWSAFKRLWVGDFAD
ncbi:MAG TPA: cell division protein FtsA [Sutterella sp.]|nr:cell division protein FtsA [Sutterella sp.]